MSAQYWVAQYVSDVFRNEPRNVGVLVAVRNDVAARFVGEGEDGALDGRRLKNFPYPDVYRQWITYWRRELARGQASSLPQNSAANFRVTEGGKVADIGGDGAGAVAAYLYSTLVSDGGLREALAETEAEEPQRVLLDVEVAAALAQAQLLGQDADHAAVPHPVRKEAPVAGRILAEYKPAFVQQNGRLYVMETVDFTKSQKKISRDHAGWSACMYRDVRAAHGDAIEPISIVRVTDADQDVEDVRNGLALLKNESDIVNWLNESERIEFLEDRRRVAFEY
jgi:hypothetical protein